jgi:hypothetical protein
MNFKVFSFNPLSMAGYVLIDVCDTEQEAQNLAASAGLVHYRIEQGNESVSSVIFETEQNVQVS